MRSEEVLFANETNIDRDRIVSDENRTFKDFLCSICWCLLWKPQACAACQNLFCNECIQTWLNTQSSTCPLCRSSYEERPVPLAIRSILAHLFIRCRNTSLGCTEIPSYEYLEQHENIDCHFLAKTCRACEQRVLRRDVDQHQNICKPIVTQCSLCRCFVQIQLFKHHQDQCAQRLSMTDEDLFELLDFSDEMILSPTSMVDLIGIESFNQTRQKHGLVRLWAMCRLMVANRPLIHLILFNLLARGLEKFIHTSSMLFMSLQIWIRTSIYSTFIFISIGTVLFSYTIDFLFQSVNDLFIILFIIVSLIVWSSIDSRLRPTQFHLNLNIKELLLFSLTILLILQIFLSIIRFYLDYIPMNIGAVCIALSMICFSTRDAR